MPDTFDVAVLGAGPGGLQAAWEAARRGARVALIEQRALGGACLHRACIPTKALVGSLAGWSRCREAMGAGAAAAPLRVDAASLFRRKDAVVAQLLRGVELVTQQRGVRVVSGCGRLRSATELDVNGTTIRTRRVIVATGSRPAVPSGLTLDGTVVLSSDDLLASARVPRRLVVIGGGVTGCECAGIYAALGASVTIVELAAQLLPQEDPEIVRHLTRALEQRGIQVQIGTRVEGVVAGPGGVRVRVQGAGEPRTLDADAVLVAVGRTPELEGLGARALGLALRGSFVAVDAYLETSVPGVFAIGDCIGGWMLAHVAAAEGTVAARNALGERVPMRYEGVPRAIFTDPEIGSVGVTEAEVAAEAVRVSRVFLKALGGAQAAGRPQGLVKLIADAGTHRLLGGHVIGERATDLVAPLALAVRQELRVEALAGAFWAHPTFAEGIGLAAEALVAGLRADRVGGGGG